MFSDPFMQRALIAAVCLGPLCALLGVFVTARRMAFFSDTIAHGALTGVAVGLWLGFADPTIALIGVSLLVAGAIFWLKEKTDLLTDTIMALLLSGSVALGIIILSLLKRRPGDIHNYLFGDIFAIRWWEVRLIPSLVVVVGIGLFLMLNRVSLITVHEDLAHVSGVPVRFMNFLFIVLLTLTVAVTIRLLGIILVTALIVVPPAAARNLSRNLRQQIVLSVVFGLLGAMFGTALSYQLDLPCGPAIVMTCIGLFILSLLPRTIVRPRPA